MASYIDLNDLGSFASIKALWAAHPEGGVEGDYCTITGVKYRWDKYDRMWVADPNFGPTPAREVTTFDGDVNIQNNLTVAGYIRAKGIKQPCLGLFLTYAALTARWPEPEVGAWALVGDDLPAELYVYDATDGWKDTGNTAGPDDIDLSSITINGIRHYVVITDHTSSDDLSDDPTDDEKGYGYLEGTKLYVYVGEGNGDSDTPGELWKGLQLKGETGETGATGLGYSSVAAHSPVDGAFDITLTNGDIITVNLNHNHSSLTATGEIDTIKFHLCEDEAAYTGITTKDSNTLYLIPESSS